MKREDITEDDISSMMDGYTDPYVRGPSLWSVLESIIIKFDSNCPRDYEMFKQLIESLIWLIPCEDCGDHFSLYIQNNPIPKTRKELLEWIITAHDNVNEYNGKDRLGNIEGLKNISERIYNRLLNEEKNQFPL